MLTLTAAGEAVADHVPQVLADVNNAYLRDFSRDEWQQLKAAAAPHAGQRPRRARGSAPMSAVPATPQQPPLSGRGPAPMRCGCCWPLVLLAAAGWGFYWATTLRYIESTDNAYVQAPLVQITPLVDGTVVAVLADDTDRVAAGQPLVRLDPTDARLALQRSQAALAQAVREVRVMRAQDGSFDAQSKLKRAEVERTARRAGARRGRRGAAPRSWSTAARSATRR